MSELIRREDAIDAMAELQGIAQSKAELTGISKAWKRIKALPTASPWRRAEDELPEMSEIVPGYVCSETLVLYDDETKHMDIGCVRRKPNGEVDWLWGLPFKTPTHWMSIEPPKEDA